MLHTAGLQLEFIFVCIVCSICMQVCTVIMDVFTFDLVEGLRYEGLDGFEPFHHKAQSGELTAAVRNQLIGQRLRKDLLEPERLEASEGRTWSRRQRTVR